MRIICSILHYLVLFRATFLIYSPFFSSFFLYFLESDFSGRIYCSDATMGSLDILSIRGSYAFGAFFFLLCSFFHPFNLIFYLLQIMVLSCKTWSIITLICVENVCATFLSFFAFLLTFHLSLKNVLFSGATLTL